MTALPFRQVHLDFHTSPHIRDIGLDFDPDEFVATLQRGHVNSVTVFAKCHHGYSYYPTKVGTVHPYLRRPDLLGEMIEAGHRAGMRVPVYTTVVWDELAWHTHPEWRHVSPGGHFVGPSGTALRAGWKNLCMNSGYGDYVIAQIEEILDMYSGDGFFIDIVRYGEPACACMTCLHKMLDEGVNPEDPGELREFTRKVERAFMARTTAAIRARDPRQHIFYNSRLRMELDGPLGNRGELDNFTHLEIESLPGGQWGYAYFPMYVRYFQTFPRELVAMTGRFHTAWGDFGGLRNRAALEFEAFEALAHGAVVSIGDQLHPSGRLDPAVYDRIGEVYAAVEAREPWCANTAPLPEIGVFTAAARVSSGTGSINTVDLGVLNALEQLKYQFQFIDSGVYLSDYTVVILPDGIPIDPALAARLRAYVAAGGRLLITGCSVVDPATGDFVLADLMGVHLVGDAPYAPDYLILGPELAEGIEPMAHSFELQGVEIAAEADTEVLAWSGAPYFNRTWQHFCSHRYTPLARATDTPLVVQRGNVITIARPVFTEYAEFSKRVHKQLVHNCLQRVLARPRVGMHNLPSTAVVTVRKQATDLIVHVLHYVPQRRGRTLDVVEDVLPLFDVHVQVRAGQQPSAVRLVPEAQDIAYQWSDGYADITIPRVNGYQIVQLVGAA